MKRVLLGFTAISVAFSPAAFGQSAAEQKALVEKYCVSCHNQRLKTANIILDTADVSNVAAAPDLWEKVVRKLHGGSMPPLGMPRPDKATLDGFASWLEASPDPQRPAR